MAVIAGGATVATVAMLGDGESPVAPTEERGDRGAGPSLPPERRAVRPVAPHDDTPPTPELAAPVLSSIEGRFRDRHGAVAGVRVTLLRLHADALLAEPSALPREVENVTFVAGEAETDTGGRFVIENVPPGGVWLVRVAQPDGPPFVQLVAERRPAGDRVDLGWCELPRYRYVRGRVVDPKLRPIAGASVRPVSDAWDAPAELGVAGALLEAAIAHGAADDVLIAVPGERGHEAMEVPAWFDELRRAVDLPAAVTDERGEFAWRAIGTGEASVEVRADGHATATVELRLGHQGGLGEEVVLEPLRDVELTVVDAHDRPVAGAEVALGVDDDSDELHVLRRVGTSDARGVIVVPFEERSRIAAVRPTPGEPFVVAPIRDGRVATFAVPPRHEVTIRCVETSGASVDGFDVLMLPGARTQFLGPGTVALHELGCIEPLDLEGRVRVRESGRIVLERVPEGRWTLVVAASGRVASATSFDVSGTTDVRVEMRPAEALRLTVVDQAFEPLRGVTVAAARGDDALSAHALPVRLGRSDLDASILLERFVHGPLDVAIAAPGRGWRCVRIDGGVRDQEIVLRGQGALVGTLASSAEGFDPRRWLLVARRADALRAVVTEPPVLVESRADGRVELADLAPGRWLVEARRMPGPLAGIGSVLDLVFESEPDRDRPRAVFDVQAGSEASFWFDPVPPEQPEPVITASFVGRVLVDGVAPRGGTLRIERDGAVTRHGLDGDGRFDAGAISPGRVRLALTVPGGGSVIEVWNASHELADPPVPLDVDIRTSPLSALIVDAAGRRVPDLEVELEGTTATAPPGAVRFVLRTDETGFVAHDRLPDGRYTLRVTDATRGWLRQRGFGVGGAHVTTGVTLALAPLIRYAGRVDERSVGVDVPRTSELEFDRIADDGVALERSVVCDAEARFEATGLLPGRYRVTLRAARWIRADDGRTILVTPAASGIVVDLEDLVVPEHDVQGAVLSRRR